MAKELDHFLGEEYFRLVGSGFLKPKLYDSICVRCRGRLLLCGKPVCPVTLEFKILLESYRDLYRENVSGNSPPSVFIGRYGYPKVNMGVMTPPESGDTSIYDYPEKWIGLSLEDILRLRSRLLYGSRRMHISIASRGDRYYQEILDISLARVSPEVELYFERKPYKTFEIDEDITPFGPRAPIKSMRLGTLKLDYRVEKISSDYDMKASESVIKLYEHGVEISRISKVFSVGGFGLRKLRRLVPTRWSITAVDDIIGRYLYNIVKDLPLIDGIYVYEYSALENRYIAILFPSRWMYEFMEAWYPGTFWNRLGSDVAVEGDHEFGRPRSEYAEIGGCYYAARLATLEYLRRIGRQAGVIIFREAYPGYYFPVGVWSVRESVRKMFGTKPIEFKDFSEAVEYIFARLRTPRYRWRSKILDHIFRQRKLTEYM